MTYKIMITDTAKAEIRNASLYIYKTLANQSAALHLLDETQDKILGLADMPYLYPLASDPILASNGIRMMVIGNYLAFYIVSEENKQATIIRFLFGKRDWHNILRNSSLDID